MTAPTEPGNGAADAVQPAAVASSSLLPEGFDVAAWAQAACEASGVPFAVEDPVVLAKLRDLVKHPA